jgi:hypothetical protein
MGLLVWYDTKGKDHPLGQKQVAIINKIDMFIITTKKQKKVMGDNLIRMRACVMGVLIYKYFSRWDDDQNK